jgi:hypothetical protein
MSLTTQSVETVAIVDLGNDIQLTYSVSGFVYTLNKLSLRVKQTDTHVFITNAEGFTHSFDNQVFKLLASEVSSPVYADNDALYAGLVAMISSVSLGGGGGGAGGGNNTWSNPQGDFTATANVGAKTITITGLGWTIEDINVASGVVKLIDSSGDVSTLDIENITVAANVITLGNIDDFVSGDTVVVTLVGPDKSYDNSLDSQIVSVLNPEYAHYTSPEHLIDVSAVGDAVTSRYVIPWEAYKHGSIHYKLSTTNAGDTITMTVWATNNEDADDSADTDWVDVSATILGAASKSANNATLEEIAFINENIVALKLMVKTVTVSGGTNTNAADVYLKKA